MSTGERRTECGVILVPSSDANGEFDASTRHDIHRRELFGDHGRRVPWQHGHVHENAHASSERSGRRTQSETVEVVEGDALAGRDARERTIVDPSAPGQQTVAVEASGHLRQSDAHGHPSAVIPHSSSLALRCSVGRFVARPWGSENRVKDAPDQRRAESDTPSDSGATLAPCVNCPRSFRSTTT